MILLVASTVDPASHNIRRHILEEYSFQDTGLTYQENSIYSTQINGKKITLATLNGESVHAQYLPDDFPSAELIVFISRHSSQSGKPTLSVHTPGNFAAAELGGLPRRLSVAPAVAMQTALKALVHYRETLAQSYEVSYECTHHGPSLNVPTMFVELGSSEEQWRNQRAAQAVAKAAMAAITEFNLSSNQVVLGIGGTHYNQKFTLMSLMGQAVFSHMIPKYAIANVDAEMLSQCVTCTLERVSMAILDWKGIRSEDKPKLLSALEEAGLPYQKA